MELEKRPVTENVEGSLDVKLAKTKQQLALVTEELKDRTKQLDAEREDSQRKLLDPTWSLLYKAMKKEVEEKTKKIELLQREMLGVGFTPSSITGKKIVAKLKAMQTENEELGKQLCQGRVEQLQTALALEKTLVEQLRREVREANEQALDLNQENEDLTAECFSLRAQLEQTRSDPRESS
ncbi:hypothetical protein HKX48_009024 [Thoreauomyces humboldtii]|nr:hypothetical protein HKX48_009024 [Thoreauomyces humboldtii]